MRLRKLGGVRAGLRSGGRKKEHRVEGLGERKRQIFTNPSDKDSCAMLAFKNYSQVAFWKVIQTGVSSESHSAKFVYNTKSN